jgi:hypothetical protein
MPVRQGSHNVGKMVDVENPRCWGARNIVNDNAKDPVDNVSLIHAHEEVLSRTNLDDHEISNLSNPRQGVDPDVGCEKVVAQNASVPWPAVDLDSRSQPQQVVCQLMWDIKLSGVLGDNPIQASNTGGYDFRRVPVVCLVSDGPTALHGKFSARAHLTVGIERKTALCWRNSSGCQSLGDGIDEVPVDRITEAGVRPTAQHVDVHLVPVVNKVREPADEPVGARRS